MGKIRGYLVSAAVLGAAAVASAPVSANLIISCGGNVGCSGVQASSSTNTQVTWGGGTFGNIAVGPVTETGLNDLGLPNLVDTENLEVAASGVADGATISLFFTETNLTAGASAQFTLDFTGRLTGNMNASRSFWLDPTNSGGLVDALGTACTAGGCTNETTPFISLSGPFSITEEITLTCNNARGCHTFLSSDDGVTSAQARIPEPLTLSLFGTGLIGIGAFRLRRRKNSKAA